MTNSYYFGILAKYIEAFSSLSPPPPRSLWLAPFPPLFGKFQHGAFASKLRAQRKRLHCRLHLQWILFCNVPHQSTKTVIGVRLTMPSSPHEFFKVFLLSSDYRPSVDRPSTERWPITDRYISEVSTNYRRSVGEVSVNEKLYRPRHIWNDYRPCLDRVSSDYRPSLDRLSTGYRPLYWPSLDRLSTDYRSTIDWLSTECRPSVDRILTAISTDRSVDTTYSKHDPVIWGIFCSFSPKAHNYNTACHLRADFSYRTVPALSNDLHENVL